MKWGVRSTPEQLGHKKRVAKYSKNSTIVRDAINSGEVPKRINREKQLRHTKTYHIKGRSYLDGDLDFAQRLVDELSGTGVPVISQSGKWLYMERVEADRSIGVFVEHNTGKEIRTNRAMIRYSKTGSHIHPRR